MGCDVGMIVCSCSGAVRRCGEAADDALSVRGVRARAVSPGERLHTHVLSQ